VLVLVLCAKSPGRRPLFKTTRKGYLAEFFAARFLMGHRKYQVTIQFLGWNEIGGSK
jgi:hypothetical protein